MADATDSKSVGGNPMRVRLSPRASATAFMLLLVSAPVTYSQQSTVHGTVVSAETGQPLGFSIVTLVPTNTKRFTDSTGAFAFTTIPAGAYLLSVRQIAYGPLARRGLRSARREHPPARSARRGQSLSIPARAHGSRSELARRHQHRESGHDRARPKGNAASLSSRQHRQTGVGAI